MIKCDYQLWNKKNKQIESCGEEATEFRSPITKGSIRKGTVYHLCKEHKEFVVDALDKYSVEKTKAEMKKETNTLFD